MVSRKNSADMLTSCRPVLKALLSPNQPTNLTSCNPLYINIYINITAFNQRVTVVIYVAVCNQADVLCLVGIKCFWYTFCLHRSVHSVVVYIESGLNADRCSINVCVHYMSSTTVWFVFSSCQFCSMTIQYYAVCR